MRSIWQPDGRRDLRICFADGLQRKSVLVFGPSASNNPPTQRTHPVKTMQQVTQNPSPELQAHDFEIRKLAGPLAAEVTGVDGSRPLSAAARRRLLDAIGMHKLLVFRDM